MLHSVNKPLAFLGRVISGRLGSALMFLFALLGPVVYLSATPSLFLFGGKGNSVSFL